VVIRVYRGAPEATGTIAFPVVQSVGRRSIRLHGGDEACVARCRIELIEAASHAAYHAAAVAAGNRADWTSAKGVGKSRLPHPVGRRIIGMNHSLPCIDPIEKAAFRVPVEGLAEIIREESDANDAGMRLFSQCQISSQCQNRCVHYHMVIRPAVNC